MSTTDSQQAIGRLRQEIRRYLCKEVGSDVLASAIQGMGLDITLAGQGYTFRVTCPAAMTPVQEESIAGLPKLYAVEPPERRPDGLIITGHDVECLPGILTELASVGLVFQPS